MVLLKFGPSWLWLHDQYDEGFEEAPPKKGQKFDSSILELSGKITSAIIDTVIMGHLQGKPKAGTELEIYLVKVECGLLPCL